MSEAENKIPEVNGVPDTVVFTAILNPDQIKMCLQAFSFLTAILQLNLSVGYFISSQSSSFHKLLLY